MNGSNRNYLQFFLFFMLGLSSWFVVSAIFSEIPLLVQLLFEAEAVGSTLDLCVNLGNIVPLLLVLFQRKLGKSGDAVIIFLSCVTNIAMSLAMIFMFPSSNPSARSSSLNLIIVTALAGVVGNTSMVTLFPYARPFGPAAITALSSGIGACGLVAQLLSTAQSVGHTRVADDGTIQPDPAFSIQVMFACVCVCSVLSLSSFIMIHKRVLFLGGEGWVRGSAGVEQPAAAVAHLLRIEPDEVHALDSASSGCRSPDSSDFDHAVGEKMSLSDSDDSSCNRSGSSDRSKSTNDGSRSISPFKLMQTLTELERRVCLILACSCFLMYELPGNCLLNFNAAHIHSTRRSHALHVRCCRQPIHHHAVAVLCLFSRLSSRSHRCDHLSVSSNRVNLSLQRVCVVGANDASVPVAKRVVSICHRSCDAMCTHVLSEQWSCLYHGLLHGFQ